MTTAHQIQYGTKTEPLDTGAIGMTGFETYDLGIFTTDGRELSSSSFTANKRKKS